MLEGANEKRHAACPMVEGKEQSMDTQATWVSPERAGRVVSKSGRHGRHGLTLLKGSVQDRQTRGRVWPGLLRGDRTEF